MSNSCQKVHCGSLLPEMGTDVLLQHAAESRPQVVESPVKGVDAVAQGVTAKGANLGDGRSTARSYLAAVLQVSF